MFLMFLVSFCSSITMDYNRGFLKNLSLLQYGTPLIVNNYGICSSPQLQKRLGSSSSFVKRFRTEHRLQGHRGCVNCINFSLEGDQLVSGSDDVKIIVWDWRKGQSVMSFQSQHVANIFQVSMKYMCIYIHMYCTLCLLVLYVFVLCNISLAVKAFCVTHVWNSSLALVLM